MMREVLIDFNVPGICIYADNAFVSVDQLRWCRDNKINLCDTTRSTFGFPAELDFDGMEAWSVRLMYLITPPHSSCVVSDCDWSISSCVLWW